MSFLKRHRDTLSQRPCQNVKRSRTQGSRKDINIYFDNLENSLNNVLPCNIINYDETNLCDDPGRIKVISKRGCKYSERVMNHSKLCTSVMFFCTGEEELLPAYTCIHLGLLVVPKIRDVIGVNPGGSISLPNYKCI